MFPECSSSKMSLLCGNLLLCDDFSFFLISSCPAGLMQEAALKVDFPGLGAYGSACTPVNSCTESCCPGWHKATFLSASPCLLSVSGQPLLQSVPEGIQGPKTVPAPQNEARQKARPPILCEHEINDQWVFSVKCAPGSQQDVHRATSVSCLPESECAQCPLPCPGVNH